MSSRLVLGINRIRRSLAKAIDPKEPERDPKWDIPIDVSLKGGAALRELLGVDEESYLYAAGQSWADPRSYVLYTALDEVDKTAMYLLRIRELLSGPTVSPLDDRMSRQLITHLLEEQRGRVRRLLEALVVLVLFETTNEQAYYRHLLLLEGLNDYLSSNSDLEEFYGARSANIDDSIDHQMEWIREVEDEIDLARTWYARSEGPLPARDKLKPGFVLSSVRARVRQAIPSMTDSERLLFGYS